MIQGHDPVFLAAWDRKKSDLLTEAIRGTAALDDVVQRFQAKFIIGDRTMGIRRYVLRDGVVLRYIDDQVFIVEVNSLGTDTPDQFGSAGIDGRKCPPSSGIGVHHPPEHAS